MITNEQANELARDWIAAWNSHDIEIIMKHYNEEIEFSSPLIVKILNKTDGTIKNKAELKTYFIKGLEAYPELKFELYHVLAGVNSIVIYYKSVKNLIGTEVLVLNNQHKIIQCLCHYKEI